jgi:phage baseplate assembly protein W
MKLVKPALRSEIASRVQDVLNRYQPRGYRIKVDTKAILEDDDWYHVVVKSPNDRRSRDFYDALAEAETELNEKEDGHQYLLVPAIADS